MKEIVYDLYKWTGIHPPVHYESNREDRKEIIPALGCDIVTLWVNFAEGIRDNYPDTWIDYWRESNHDADIIVAPDLRNVEETYACHKRYKIHNPRVPNREGSSIDHLLENFTDWDRIVVNDKDLRHLNSQMIEIGDDLIREFDLVKQTT